MISARGPALRHPPTHSSLSISTHTRAALNLQTIQGINLGSLTLVYITHTSYQHRV